MLIAKIDGEDFCVHLPNSGRLATTLYPGTKLYLRRRRGRRPHRIIYSAFAAQNGDITVIVDSHFSNKLFKEAVGRGLFDELVGYRVVKENVLLRELRIRPDFLLKRGDEAFYAEVKSVTHVVGGVALFPDAPTARGGRQILQLTSLLKGGSGAGLVFSVQRPDAVLVKPNSNVDPSFADLLWDAVKNGLKVLTLRAIFEPPDRIRLKPNDPPFSL